MSKRSTLVFLCALAGLFSEASAEDLKDILARMDKAAPEFHSMSARLKIISHTAILNDDDEDDALLHLKRTKSASTDALLQYTKHDQKSVRLHRHQVEIYYPKVKMVQEYDVGRNSDLLDQYLLLGFGTPGKELAASYDITVVGMETVAGTQTTRMMLVPKNKEAREHLEKVEMWIPEKGAEPVQQKFYQPSKNYTLITFTEYKANPPMPDSALKLNLPPGVQREHPGKGSH